MTPIRRTFARLPSLLILAALPLSGLAQTRDHADISQLLQAGQAQQALAQIDQRLATQPRDAQLRFLRGVAQSDAGQPAEAIASFGALTEEFPELPEPHNNLAVLYAQQGQWDKARLALELALRSRPDYATAQENLGDVYAQLARQAYARALQLDASKAPALGLKLARIGELFRADPPGKPERPATAIPTPAAVSAAAAQAITAAAAQP